MDAIVGSLDSSVPRSSSIPPSDRALRRVVERVVIPRLALRAPAVARPNASATV